jgi:TonB family protein
MRCSVTVCAVLFLCCSAMCQDRSAAVQPSQFEIGRHTFFDFGPPFDFYEIFIVRPSATGTSVQRITLTLPGQKCVAPAEVKAASASTNESVAKLMGGKNPCTIPEKALRRESKRCKKCSVFSGADVVLQVRCGTVTRLIRTDILEKDWFDASPHTPEHASWTMQLLGRLDDAVGPGIMDRPIFLLPEKGEQPENAMDWPTLRDVSAGKYDALFQGTPDIATDSATGKPSDLYRAAQDHPFPPVVRLLNSSVPLREGTFIPPTYPPIARLTGTGGRVSFKIEVDPNGKATKLSFESGHPLLRQAVNDAVSQWRFPKEATSQEIQITIEFGLNCSRQADQRVARRRVRRSFGTL